MPFNIALNELNSSNFTFLSSTIQMALNRVNLPNNYVPYMNRPSSKHKRIRERQAERAKAGSLQSKTWSRETVPVTRIQSGELAYDVFYEPLGDDWPDRVITLYTQALLCLRRQEWKEAQRLMLLALQLRPNEPKLRNNLALALNKLGRLSESRDLILKLHEDYPDYIFARTALANQYMREHRLEEARALLRPICEYKRLHFDELKVLCQSLIHLYVFTGEILEAEKWFDLLKEVDPENELLHSEMAITLSAFSAVSRMQADLKKRSARSAARASKPRVARAKQTSQMALPFD